MPVARFSTLALACTLPFTLSAQNNATTAQIHEAFPATTISALSAQINTLLADPNAARAHWGIAVTELDGTPIYGLDEGKLFRPASNAKLFTTAAAMAILGPADTVTTTVEGDMDHNGTVHSDLRLVGHGDANFGANDIPYIAPKLRPVDTSKPRNLADIDELVEKLKHAGLKQVLGNIVGDDSYFPSDPVVGSWDFGDLVWGYGAPVSALTIADNQFALSIAPDKSSNSVTITLDQYGVPFYTITRQVTLGEPGSGTHIDVEHIGPQKIRVFGSIASDATPDTEHISIDEPALFAAMALRQRLASSGITVSGSAIAAHFLPVLVTDSSRPLDNCEKQSLGLGDKCLAACYARWQQHPLATHTSPTLAEDAKYTLKVSQNLHAELLARRIGSHAVCPLGSSVNSARLMKAYLSDKAGLDPNDFVFYDGSGLSGHDLITPRAAAQLIAYATKQPWFAQWKAALPVGGEDGSLASRFASAPLKDHVFAKTGTLGESRALSGYLDTASGKQVIFSILVDDHAPSGSNDREVMDKVVAAIAANN